MIKRKAALFVAALLLLCGCENNTPSVTTVQTDTGTQSVTITEPATEITEVITSVTTEMSVVTVELADFSEKISDNFYKITGSECYIENIVPVDEKTIAYTCSKNASEGMGSSYLSVLDFETGVTKEICISESYNYLTITVLDGYIALMCGTEGVLEIYDKELCKISEHTFSASDIGLHTVAALDDSTAAVIDGSNCLSIISVDDSGNISMKEKNFPLEEGSIFGNVIGSLSEDTLIVTVYNGDGDYTYVWETEKEETTELSLDWPAYCTYLIGGKLIGTNPDFGEVNIYDYDIPYIKKTFSYPNGYEILNLQKGSSNLYFADTEGNLFSLKRYSAETGSCTAELQMSASIYASVYSVFEMGDYVVMAGNICDDYAGIYIWLPETVEQDDVLFPTLTEYGYRAKSKVLAEKIKEEYGIDVYSGKDGVKFFTGYAVVAETSDWLIYNALETIDGICGEFPDGFFEEMKSAYGENADIAIYLTGRIVPDTQNDESISTAAGFTNTENLTDRIIVMDITQYGMDATFVHELMHAIEDTIYMKSYNDYEETFEAFSRWRMLNPADFDYSYTYTDEMGITTGYDVTQNVGAAYYEGGEISVDSVYFVDEYSTTFMTEDIARIFENIFFSDKVPLYDYFESRNMQLKSAYLCACIEEAFDCMDGAEVCWDNSINPEYTLDYFRENYDLDEYWNSFEAVG